jgi:hypothetical protein
MVSNFATYRVEKTVKKSASPDGEALPTIAVIALLNEKEDVVSTLELQIADMEELYELIADGQAVNLDKCYIENFSLAALREKKNLRKSQFLEINDFIATNCVFYSEGEIDFSYARFTSGQLDFRNTLFLGELDFTHSSFGDGDFLFDNSYFHQEAVVFAKANFGKGLLSFKNSSFSEEPKAADRKKSKTVAHRRRAKGILNFEETTFEKGKIDFTRSNLGSGQINFSNAKLDQRDLLFVSVEFNKVRLTFKAVDFKSGKLDFRFANFEKGDLFFDRSIFGKSIIDFSATEFQQGKISFNRVEFYKNDLIFESSEMGKGRVIFKNNIFSIGNIDFKSVHYRTSDILFDNVDFGKTTCSFSRSRVNNLSFNSCQVNAFFNLQLKQCNAVDFSNSVVRDIVDMKPFGFKTDINSLNLSGLLLLGHFHIDWEANNVKDLILGQETTYRNRSEQFRILKENYRSLGQYDAEDEAYVEFRRAEAKADLQSELSKGNFYRKLKAYISYGFKWLIFDKIGLYATSPIRVLISMVVTYLIFVLIYFILPFVVESSIFPSIEHGDSLSQLEVAFYHSVVTFLTIGYGDYYPAGIFRWISGFEGFMGLFLISYFTVAFVRKALR